MYIKKLQVYNYKSYFDSGVMEFSPGVNIIVGRNNAGKTSLLEVLTLDFEDHPHRSLKTLPNKGMNLKEKSKIEITFHIDSEEDNYSLIKHRYENCATYTKREELKEKDYLEIPVDITSGERRIDIIIPYTKVEQMLNIGLHPTGVDIFRNKFKKLFTHVYRFRAERLNIGVCQFEQKNQLKSDASNLAEVLFILQGQKPGTFSDFNKKISIILEEIKYISVVPRDNSEVEIKVWINEELNRDDLSLPLSSCGSGVGQVLAIVYILVSSEEPRTLIIDEPQSFLHPGAAKKLIETIKQFPQHQYFIATHSPEIITTADPSNIIKLKYENCETTASVIDAKDIEKQKEILDELGVRLSDVFGADSIIWVEGPTEEKCFPLIIHKLLAEMPLKGMKILSVKSTDALLDGKHSSLVADIYEELKSGISLIPEKSIFIFDREKKTDKQIEDLKRRGFKFLKLPMYENYILSPEAIAAIINKEAVWLETSITITQVQEYLDKIKQEKSYLLPGVKEKDVADENWLSKVHGANILENLFQNFCGTLLGFKKTTHSPKITEWIIKNQPEFLYELAKELKEYLNLNKKK